MLFRSPPSMRRRFPTTVSRWRMHTAWWCSTGTEPRSVRRVSGRAPGWPHGRSRITTGNFMSPMPARAPSSCIESNHPYSADTHPVHVRLYDRQSMKVFDSPPDSVVRVSSRISFEEIPSRVIFRGKNYRREDTYVRSGSRPIRRVHREEPSR